MSGIKKSESNPRWRFLGIILGAVGASICCIGPLLLLALGIGGAWVSNLTALEAYRPYFIGITLIFLGVAFYQVYKPKQTECEPGSSCEVAPSKKKDRMVLWVLTFVALGLMAFPYFVPQAAAIRQETRTLNQQHHAVAILKVNNLTCSSCALGAEYALSAKEGVLDASVKYEEGKATVTFDPSVITPEELTKATDEIGYPSTIITIKNSTE